MGKHAEKLWGLATAVALAWTSAIVGCGGDEVNNPLPAPQPASVRGRLTATRITNENSPSRATRSRSEAIRPSPTKTASTACRPRPTERLQWW
jgi:hypothetical protein